MADDGRDPALAAQGKPRLQFRWRYSPGVAVSLFAGWMCGCFLPLTVFVPAAFATGVTEIFHVAVLLFALLGLPVINFVGATQAQLASQAFDAAETQRLRPVKTLVDAIFAATSKAEALALRARLERVYESSLRRRRETRLASLRLIACCGRSERGRLACWRGEIFQAALVCVFAIAPCIVLLPLGYAPNLDLSYSFDAPQAVRSMYFFAAAPPLVYLAWTVSRAWRRLRANRTPWSKRLKELRRALRRQASRHGSSSAGDRGNTTASRASGRPGDKSIELRERTMLGTAPSGGPEVLESADPDLENEALPVTCASLIREIQNFAPRWVYWEAFCFWLFVLLPLLLFPSVAQFYGKRDIPPVYWSTQEVQGALRTTGYLMLTFFASAFLLLESLSTRKIPQLTREGVRQHVKDELECVWLCSKLGWPIESIGDYPNFSIGEGVVTKRLFYHDQLTTSILLPRMYFNFALATAIPIAIGLGALLSSPSNISWVIGLQATLPCLCLLFYLGKLMVGVTPARRLHALPCIALWVVCALVVPLAGGAAVLSATPYKYLGIILVTASPAWLVFSLLAWAYAERAAFGAWRRALTIQRSWLMEVTSAFWKMSYAGLVATDLAMLGVGATLELSDTMKSSALLLVFSSVASCLHVLFYLNGVVAGVVRADRGITSTPSLVSLFLRFLIFGYAWMQMSTLHAGKLPMAGVSSLLTQSYSLQTISLVCVVVVFVITFAQSVRLYRTYELKRQYGYFPTDWELVFPPRNVIEHAHRVVEFPVDAIMEDLRARGLIDPSARELLRMYIDPKFPEPERMSIKNKLFLAAAQPGHTRAELETMLERAISDDVHLLASFEDRLLDKRDRQLKLVHDKDAILRTKFATFKGAALLAALQAAEDVPVDGADLSALDADDFWGPDPNLSAQEQEVVDLVADNAGLLELPALFANSARFSIFHVSKISPWRARKGSIAHAHFGSGPRGPSSAAAALRTAGLADGGARELPSMGSAAATFSLHAREVLVLDGERHRLLMLHYRVWRLHEIFFSRITSLRWFADALSPADSCRLLLTVQRPPSASCSIRTRPTIVTYNLYFTSAEERERFCMKFYVLTCLHGSGAGGQFRYDSDGAIYRPVNAEGLS